MSNSRTNSPLLRFLLKPSVRWSMVIPGAILAHLIVGTIILLLVLPLWKFSMTPLIPGDEGISLTILKFLLDCLLHPFVTTIAYIITGITIAPSKKMETAAFLVCLRFGFGFLALSLQTNETPLPFYMVIIAWVIEIGAVFAALKFVKGIRDEGGTFEIFTEEDVDEIKNPETKIANS